MAGMSPTQLTLRKLKSEGYETVQVVEVWIPFGKFGNRRDLFGAWDILAVKDGETTAIQVTSKSNISARVKKISENEHVGNLRDANWKLLVHGWFKNKSNRWECKEIDVS
jgi:hypothetical protein